MTIEREKVIAVACALARQSFYAFCKILYPKFYRDDRPHLKTLCDTLQLFVDNKIPEKNLMICLPPRFGKSYTTQNLSKWLLGRQPDKSIITVSYGQTLSIRAGKEVRNSIAERKIEGGRIVFSDIFPGVTIKDGDGAQDVWALDGSHFSYLSTSPTGALTGTGASGFFIVDDILKDATESFNDRILQERYDWYTDTALSRVEAGAKKLIIMTRWGTKDLAGRLLASEPEKWKLIKMPACLDESTGKMLCDNILNFEEYKDRKIKTDPVIFASNYQQAPYDSCDNLYSQGFKTYAELPKLSRIENYTDTADTGADSLCSITYGIANNCAYVLDVIFTKKPMEITEPMVAEAYTKYKVGKAFIESNNGGRGFSRNVLTLIREAGNHETVVEPFTQTGNKVSRILSNATSCQNSIVMPDGWQYMWPEFHSELMRMGRAERWNHDDSADCLSGIFEKSLSKPAFFMI